MTGMDIECCLLEEIGITNNLNVRRSMKKKVGCQKGNNRGCQSVFDFASLLWDCKKFFNLYYH